MDDDIVEVALFDLGPAADHDTGPGAVRRHHKVAVSGEHGVDLMNRTAHKGAAVPRLQHEPGITPAQTTAFGDYPNDLEMPDRAEWSFAMAGAHPEVVARARHLAPAHTDNGVLRTITRLLDLPAQ